MIRLLLCLSVHFALNSTTLGQSAPWDDVPLVKVTEVTLPTSVLKGKWKSSDGVQIDDLSKANRQLPGRRELIEALEKTGPNGLRSVADYTLVATGFPLNTVTVRVFIFEETSQCEEWWKKSTKVMDGTSSMKSLITPMLLPYEVCSRQRSRLLLDEYGLLLINCDQATSTNRPLATSLSS